MVGYEQAKNIAFSNTFPNGILYYAGDAGLFYIFIIVSESFPFDAEETLIGSTFTAVDKLDGKVWICHVTDRRIKHVKRLYSIKNG